MMNGPDVSRPAARAGQRAILPLLAAILLTLGAGQARAAPASQETGEPIDGWGDASRNALRAALADRARHGLDRVDFLEVDADTSVDALRPCAMLRH